MKADLFMPLKPKDAERTFRVWRELHRLLGVPK